MTILLSEERDDILLLTLNRPESHNALSNALAEKLREALEAASVRRDLRAVILTGAGDKAFCAGTDLKERRTLSADEKWAQRTRGWLVNRLMWQMPQPIIAAIHGWCLGGGFELALFSDFRIATPESVFSFPETALGAYPGSGGPIALSHLIGRAWAKEILFSSRRVPAEEALKLGIVESLEPRETLLDRAFEFAESFKTSSPLGLAAVKRLLNQGSDLPLDTAMDLNDALRRPLEATKDYLEGIEAFFEKRKPKFKGE